MNKIILFPGQGSQILGMGKDIYSKYNTAKNIFDKVDNILNIKLTEIMFQGPSDQLNMTKYAQIALLAHSVALLETIFEQTSKDIRQLANFVSGHSVGEYSALCAAGSISLQTAINLLRLRGEFMQEACELSDGAMAACMNIEKSNLEEILDHLSMQGVCVIANDNSDNQIVISGHKHLIEQAIAKIKQAQGKAILLKVSGAFHSPLMQQAQEKMAQVIDESTFFDAKVPIVMNVTALPTTSAKQIKQNLKQQITHSVKWRQSILFANQNKLELMEIGSANVLINLAKRDNYPHVIENIADAASLEKFLSGA